jgi:hypothetical protein
MQRQKEKNKTILKRTTGLPSLTSNHQLPATSCQLPAACYQLSAPAACYQLSATSCQLTAFCYQLSATNCLLPAVGYPSICRQGHGLDQSHGRFCRNWRPCRANGASGPSTVSAAAVRALQPAVSRLRDQQLWPRSHGGSGVRMTALSCCLLLAPSTAQPAVQMWPIPQRQQVEPS